MKIRSGFVSNSSSCSFVLGKAYMTEDQGREFSSFLRKNNNADYDEETDEYTGFYEETYVHDSEYYFHGTVEYSDIDKIADCLKEIGVDAKYAIFDS